jgi:hypothetical protein
LASPAQSACTIYELVNFDVYNFTDYQVDGLILVLEGIACWEIDHFWEGYYPGYYDSITCIRQDGLTYIEWHFPLTPPQVWMHFGLQLKPYVSAPTPAYCAWTFGGSPVSWGEIMIPWVRWEGSVDCPVNGVLDWNETDPYFLGVWVERWLAPWWWEIPLENLNRSDPMFQDVNWEEHYPQYHLEPWWYLDMEIFMMGHPALITMYNVWSYDQSTEYMWFIGEVIVDYASGTEESSWGRIKSMYR